MNKFVGILWKVLFIYINAFFKRALSWQGLKVANDEEKYGKILEKKKSISIKELCPGVPREMETFVSYVKIFEFIEVQNYDYLGQLLKNILNLTHYHLHYPYNCILFKF